MVVTPGILKKGRNLLFFGFFEKITSGDRLTKQEHKSILTCIEPPMSADGQKIKIWCLVFNRKKGDIIFPSSTNGYIRTASIFRLTIADR